MNDNQQPWSARPLVRNAVEARDTAYLTELGDIATRALVKPESLTMGEIQEIGWGFLVASRGLYQPDAQPLRDQ